LSAVLKMNQALADTMKQAARRQVQTNQSNGITMFY
jgi:hypothetical protein